MTGGGRKQNQGRDGAAASIIGAQWHVAEFSPANQYGRGAREGVDLDLHLQLRSAQAI